MRLYKNQTGFSHIVALLLIVVLSAVSLVGYRVYSSNKGRQDSTSQVPSQQPMPETEKEVIIPTDFKQYENQELGIRFAYPKEWGDEITINRRARVSEEREPIKTYFISIGSTKLQIRISPINWKLEPYPDTEADAPLNYDQFERELNIDGGGTLKIFKTDNAYLNMEYNLGYNPERTESVALYGAKKIDLPKINASYVEFDWAPVDPGCTTSGAGGEAIRPLKTCYEESLITQTQKIIESFRPL